MLVCHCNKVCDGVIRRCVREGARSLEDVKAACRAGGDCGGCLPLVHRLILVERAHIASEGAALSVDRDAIENAA